MKIAPNQDFLDGEDRYKFGQAYDVSIEKGVYFCNNGWADSVEIATGESNTDQVVDLEIQNVSVAVKDSNG